MVAKLLLSQDGVVIKEFRLNRVRTLIGRRPTNDIQIDNLAVSGEHAAIERGDEHYDVVDLESTNGTLVNGAGVTRYTLRQGDVISIGKFQLEFRVEAKPVQQTDFERTMVLAAPLGAMPPSSAPLAATHAAQPKGCVRVTSGRNAGRELPLDKQITTLGKAGVQVAVIARNATGFTLAHVEGATRPKINGQPVGAQPMPLRHGDSIELLGVQMSFELQA